MNEPSMSDLENAMDGLNESSQALAETIANPPQEEGEDS